jgi:hypothetical protein
MAFLLKVVPGCLQLPMSYHTAPPNRDRQEKKVDEKAIIETNLSFQPHKFDE